MALFAGFPLLQVLLNSFKVDSEAQTRPLGLPKEWIFTNYKDTWEIGGYARAYFNTLMIAFFVVIFVVVLVGFSSYALSKLEFKGREFFTAYFFVAISIPGFSHIVPDYFLFNKLGLIDSRWGLIIVYVAIIIPFSVLLLKNFLAGIPRELEEAAKIDGCNEIDALVHVTFPIAKPIVMTVALLAVVRVWNEFLWANTFIQTDELKNVSTRFVKFVGEYNRNMARIYTASVIAIAPVIVMYTLFSKKFIEGMTSGSVKG